jgi:hypothetical protein
MTRRNDLGGLCSGLDRAGSAPRGASSPPFARTVEDGSLRACSSAKDMPGEECPPQHASTLHISHVLPDKRGTYSLEPICYPYIVERLNQAGNL